MAERLSVKDGIQEWINKINAILELQNVDGAFVNSDTSWDNTVFTISGGKVRSGTNIIDVPGASKTLPVASISVVGVDVQNQVIEFYPEGNVPATDFIPLYVVTTNNTRITSVEDARTWAYEDSGAAADAVSEHEGKADPHSQYYKDGDDISLGHVTTGSGADQDLGAALDQRVIYVDTLADLQALPTSGLVDGQGLKITTTGRAGDFIVRVGDFSAEVTNDPESGVWAPFDSDPTGGSIVAMRVEDDQGYVEHFGAVDGQDSTVAIQAALDYMPEGSVIRSFSQGAPTYLFSALTIGKDFTFAGSAKYKGSGVIGTKPTSNDLRTADLSTSRNLLRSYVPARITLSGTGVSVDGTLRLENCGIEGSFNLSVVGNLIISGDSYSLETEIRAEQSGTISIPGGVSSSYSKGVGLFATLGGSINAPSSRIYHADFAGARITFGGSIDVRNGEIYGCTQYGGYVLHGGTLHAGDSIVEANGKGLNVIYQGSIEAPNVQSINNTGAGLAVESNCSAYVENGVFDGNNRGIATSYGGFVQARNGSVQNNTLEGVWMQTGGEVNVEGATISGNNGGSANVQIFANGNSTVIAEMPGSVGTGKDALSPSSYSPGYKTIGNGKAYIADFDDPLGSTNFPDYPVEDTGFSINRYLISRREVATISSGQITTDSSWMRVGTEGGATSDNLDNIVRNPDFPCDVVWLQPAVNGEDVVVRHNQGNIRTRDGADITLSFGNDIIMLVWNKQNSAWVQI